MIHVRTCGRDKLGTLGRRTRDVGVRKRLGRVEDWFLLGIARTSTGLTLSPGEVTACVEDERQISLRASQPHRDIVVPLPQRDARLCRKLSSVRSLFWSLYFFLVVVLMCFGELGLDCPNSGFVLLQYLTVLYNERRWWRWRRGLLQLWTWPMLVYHFQGSIPICACSSFMITK